MFRSSKDPLKILALVRISLAALMLVETLQVRDYLDDLFGPYGFLKARLVDALTRGVSLPSILAKVSLFSGVETGSILSVVWWIYVAALVLLLVGYKSRPASVLAWLGQTVWMNSGFQSSYGVNRYFQLLAFLIIWMPVGKAYSVDSILSARGTRKNPLPGNPMATFCLRVLQFAILITYVNSGISKAMGTDWWTGDAIWRALNLPEFRQYDFAFLYQHASILKLICRGTLFLETFYIIGVWIPYIRVPWIAAIISMHLGIIAFMGLRTFGATMCVLNISLFLVEALQRAAAPPADELSFECPIISHTLID